jgi:catechol 2,3-dioxygenase-like lactoylglutathione lyase family enzyme
MNFCAPVCTEKASAISLQPKAIKRFAVSLPAIDYPILFLYTRDLTATDRFYQDVIGLEIARDQEDCHIYHLGPGYVGFCQRENTPDHPIGVILTLVTDDVDGWYDALLQRGVQFDQPPALNPQYNIYHCFLHDPNGYLIEIQRFGEPL